MLNPFKRAKKKTGPTEVDKFELMIKYNTQTGQVELTSGKEAVVNFTPQWWMVFMYNLNVWTGARMKEWGIEPKSGMGGSSEPNTEPPPTTKTWKLLDNPMPWLKCNVVRLDRNQPTAYIMFRDWRGKAIRIYISTKYIYKKTIKIKILDLGNTEETVSVILPIQWKQGYPHRIVKKDSIITNEEHNKQVEEERKRQIKKMEKEARKNERSQKRSKRRLSVSSGKNNKSGKTTNKKK